MAALKPVRNTGPVLIHPGDVCIADATLAVGVAQSAAAGQAAVAGVAIGQIGIGGVGYVQTGGVARVRCAASTAQPLPAGTPLMAGVNGTAVVGTTNPLGTLTAETDGAWGDVALALTPLLDSDVTAAIATAAAAAEAYADAAIAAAPHVTSVALTAPAEWSVSGSPITTSGTLALSKVPQSPNSVWAGPASGTVAGTPAFRALGTADIPALSYVASVGLTVPAEWSVSGSPVTGSGTLAVSKAPQAANRVYAGPASGTAAGTPAFRALVEADQPVTVVGLAPPQNVVVTSATSFGSYFVRATNAAGQRSGLAFGQGTVGANPPALTAPGTVTWPAVAGATAYEVWEAVYDLHGYYAPRDFIGSTAGTALVDTGQRLMPTPQPAAYNATAARLIDGPLTTGALYAGYLPVDAMLAPAITATGSGSLTGTFYYVFTLWDVGGHESRPGTELSQVLSSGAITFTYAQVDGALPVRVYRGTASGVYDRYLDLPAASAGSTPTFLDDGTVAWSTGATPPTTGGAAALGTDPVHGDVFISHRLGVGMMPTTQIPGYRLYLPNTADPYGKGIAKAWDTYSARRWKEAEVPVAPADALTLVQALAATRFRWRQGGTPDVGFIAEDVLPLIPEAVSVDGDGQPWGLSDRPLVAILWAAVQALAARVAVLEGGADAP